MHNALFCLIYPLALARSRIKFWRKYWKNTNHALAARLDGPLPTLQRAAVLVQPHDW